MAEICVGEVAEPFFIALFQTLPLQGSSVQLSKFISFSILLVEKRCEGFPRVMKVCCSFLHLSSFSSFLIRHTQRRQLGCLVNWIGSSVLFTRLLPLDRGVKVDASSLVATAMSNHLFGVFLSLLHKLWSSIKP